MVPLLQHLYMDRTCEESNTAWMNAAVLASIPRRKGNPTWICGPCCLLRVLSMAQQGLAGIETCAFPTFRCFYGAFGFGSGDKAHRCVFAPVLLLITDEAFHSHVALVWWVVLWLADGVWSC